MAISTRTDEEIQRDVLDELKWDMRVRPNEVGVSVKDGIVSLTGWVDSYMKKLAAESAAHRVPGVMSRRSSTTSRCACPALPNAPTPTWPKPCSMPSGGMQLFRLAK
jgi:hypothetical protein